MRSSVRSEAKWMHSRKGRGLLSRGRYGKGGRRHYSALVAGGAAFLLLVGLVWLLGDARSEPKALVQDGGGSSSSNNVDNSKSSSNSGSGAVKIHSLENERSLDSQEKERKEERISEEKKSAASLEDDESINLDNNIGTDRNTDTNSLKRTHPWDEDGDDEGQAENKFSVEIKPVLPLENSASKFTEVAGKAQKRNENPSDSNDDNDTGEICDRRNFPKESELIPDKFTILVNGFSESRMSLLERHIQIYSGLSFVDSIYILWGNTSTPAEILDNWSFPSYGASVYIVRQDTMSLNDRFLPRSFIKTKAVMICDDDITVDVKSLAFALDVWKEDESRIVGFFPRTHAYDYESHTWMYVKHYKSYSLILTKLMILATEYLYLYTCDMPKGVKEYVDAGMNCEDIAMNFLVSNRTGRGPMLVEGTARDWGDPRNSATAAAAVVTEEQQLHFSDSALSARKDHRKDRGACITAFQKLWKGMKLQLSYSKAYSDLENEIQCEKFGYLIDCDTPVTSTRGARRAMGENLVSITQRYAYTTLLTSDRYVNASLLLAQTLRSTGTVHDLVLMVDPSSCSPIETSHVLRDHYDEIVNVSVPEAPAGAAAWGSAGSEYAKLSAWLLLDYVKVIYLEVDSLVVANLDHLFQLPEPAAAPRVFMPDKFSTGLLVLKPSNNTYLRLSQSLNAMRAETTQNSNRKLYLLNSFFTGWFDMPAENRLPVRYNMPVVFPERLQFPSKFNFATIQDSVRGPFMVVRYGNSKLDSAYPDSGCSFQNPWCTARLGLFESLVQNNFFPLEGDQMINWAPRTRVNNKYSRQIPDSIWPPPLPVNPSHMLVKALPSSSSFSSFSPSKSKKTREAFVTLLYGDQHPLFSVVGWAESLHYHSSRSRFKTLLLVVSSVDPDNYIEFGAYFDEIRLVEPVVVGGELAHPSSALLHLWNQVDFEKLVYVAADSLFVENCNSLFDYSPFAAVPSLFPPDTFSTRVMSLRPDRQTYDALKQEFLSYEYATQPIDKFLNGYYDDWYQKSTTQRMNPSYMVSMAFNNHAQSSLLPPKVLGFDLDWNPEHEPRLTKMWRKIICNLESLKKPQLVLSLCGGL